MKFEDIYNQSDLTLNDISSEDWREYDFGSQAVRIVKPLALNVSKAGGHRVIDAEGVSHYVPKGWIHLSWKSKEGQPHLVL